jgi:phage terminase large subunit-like protein
LTGLYPETWKGKRFSKGIRCWAAGVTSLTTRDIIQRKLLGPPGQIGTGWVPAEAIVKLVPSRGIPGAIDYAIIKHASGGLSYIYFKSYEQGSDKFQGDSIDLLWFDEEPPMKVWTEGIARLTATQGIAMMTFTPLKGLSEVVRGFYPSPDSHEKSIVRMELEDARHEDGTGHISDDEIKLIIKRYPRHEQEARTKGIPVFGSGLVFLGDIAESQIVETPQEPGKFWRKIVGLDIGGGEHATAFSVLAHDTETDVLHLLHTYQQVDPRIAVHAAAINSTAPRVPVAWPKDAHIKDRWGGIKYAEIYRRHGVEMLRDHAQWPEDHGAPHPTSVEAGIAEIYDRMASGRFKAPYSCTHFWDEARTYHRVKGVIHKSHDDTMDSIRYAVMMLRYARRARERDWPTHATSHYDPLDPDRGRARRMH